MELEAVFVGELAGDGIAVAIFCFVDGAVLFFEEADVSDGVDGDAFGGLFEDGGVEGAGSEIGKNLVEVGVVDEAKGEVGALFLAAQGDE